MAPGILQHKSTAAKFMACNIIPRICNKLMLHDKETVTVLFMFILMCHYIPRAGSCIQSFEIAAKVNKVSNYGIRFEANALWFSVTWKLLQLNESYWCMIMTIIHKHLLLWVEFDIYLNPNPHVFDMFSFNIVTALTSILCMV